MRDLRGIKKKDVPMEKKNKNKTSKSTHHSIAVANEEECGRQLKRGPRSVSLLVCDDQSHLVRDIVGMRDHYKTK